MEGVSFFFLYIYFSLFFRSGQWCLLAGCAPRRQWTGGCLETSSWLGLSLCPSLALSARPSWPCSPMSFCEALKVLSASLSALKEEPGSPERSGGHVSTFPSPPSLSNFLPPVILVMSGGWKRPLTIEPVILGCIIFSLYWWFVCSAPGHMP